MIMDLIMQRILENYLKQFCRVLYTYCTILLSLFLSSCGFHPVYENLGKNVMPQIQINSINSVAGAELYRHLSDLIGNSQGAPYQLDITLTYSSSPLAITKSSDVIQQSAMQSVAFRLTNDLGIVVFNSGFNVNGSYNTSSSAYATYIEEKQENLELAKKAAREIHRRLIIYFSTHVIKD